MSAQASRVLPEECSHPLGESSRVKFLWLRTIGGQGLGEINGSCLVSPFGGSPYAFTSVKLQFPGDRDLALFLSAIQCACQEQA